MKNLPRFRPTRRAAWLALLLGLAGAAQAQQRTPLYVGLTTGLNLATYTGPGTAGIPTGLKSGAALGLRVAYPLTRLAAVQLEAVYAQKGVRQTNYQTVYNAGAAGGGSCTYHAALGYLDMPLLLVLGPGAADQARGVYVALGSQLSLALHKREWVRTTSPNYEETLDDDRRTLTPVTAGYVAGLGYQFGNGLGAEVRYSGDFDPVYRPGNGAGSYYAGASNQLRNGVWQVQLSFRLRGSRSTSSTTTTAESRPHPSPAEQEAVLRAHPGLRRVVQVLTVLSWLDVGRGPRPGCGPVYRPAPSWPAPAPSQRFPLPAPRPQPGRPLPDLQP